MGKRKLEITHYHNFIFCFLFLISCVLFPACPSSAEESVHISSDYLEYFSQTNSYIAKGSVKIVFGDTTLRSDEMHLDNNTSDAVVIGNVVYKDPEAIIRAEKIELNLKSKIGQIYESYIFYKKHNFHLHAGNIKKTGDKTFFLDKATVTTCDADPPEWHISGKDIKATQHKSIRGWNTSFYIKKTPVLYAPYFWAPLLKERQTGLLFPSFGYSSRRGYYYKQGFFWAIKDNQDATLYLDYYSEKGLAQGIDYRYAITPETNGELWMYHVRDDEPSRNLFEIKSYHNQKLRNDMYGYLKIHTVNETDYYKVMDSTSLNRIGLESWETDPFGFATEERLQKYLESNMHFTKPFYGGRTYLLGQYRKGLEGSSRSIPQNLPEIGIVLNTRSKGPVSFLMEMKGANFWREEDQKGLRFDIYPNFYLSYGRLINITQKIGLRETAYFLDNPAINKHRLLFDLSTALKTKFFKKYATAVHIVEPSLEYILIPSVDHDNIPFLDSVDSIPQTSEIHYSLTNRISGLTTQNLETRFRLSQSYSLLDVEKEFTPLLAEATMSSNKLDFDVNASYDVHDRIITETIASVKLKSKKGYIGVGKNFRRSSLLDQVTFEAGTKRPITFYRKALPLDLNGKLWYDLNGNGVQKLKLISTYKSQCWGLSAAFIREPDEYQVTFTIEFTGLGTLSLGSI